MGEKRVIRVLEWFEKSPGDKLVGTERLDGVNLSDLQSLFGVNPETDVDSLMYDCYPVNQRHVSVLQRFVTHRIDLRLYDYFVSCFADDRF